MITAEEQARTLDPLRRFAIWCAPSVGHPGWLGRRLDRGFAPDGLAGILEDAYAAVAPTKLVEAAAQAGAARVP